MGNDEDHGRPARERNVTVPAMWEWFTSPGWSGWATIAGVLTGAGTVVLAIAAILQGRAAKDQLKLGNEQARIAGEQLKHSQDAAKSAAEAADAAALVQRASERARADQGAPRVAVYFDDPSMPTHVSSAPDPGLTPAQKYRELRLKWAEDNESSSLRREFTLPKDAAELIGVSGAGWMKNEGDTVARVRLPYQAWFSNKDEEYRGFAQGPRHDGVAEAVVNPGATVSFRWLDIVPLRHWVQASKRPGLPVEGDSIWLWTVIFDRREVGVIDTVLAKVQLNGVRPVEGSSERWEFEGAGKLKTYVLPTRRNYRTEGAETEDVSQMYEYYGLGPGGLPKTENPA